ncbi:hemolysin family protein [soil metagenome]
MLLFFTGVMLLLSGFFSGSEIAFVTANRLRAEVRARRSGWAGRLVREFLHDPATFLTTTLVGNNIALIIYSTLMTIQLDPVLQHFWLGILGTDAAIGGWVLATETIIATSLVLVFGEIIPKTLLREPSDAVLMAIAAPLKVTYWLLLPIIKLAGWASSWLVKLAGADADSLRRFMRRDLEVLVRESRESGALDLDEEESELLENVLELRNLRAKNSMIPRTSIEAVHETATLEEVRQRFIETGYSRLPVYRENIDEIVGVVVAYDLFKEPELFEDIIRPIRAVPEAKRANDLLEELLASGTSMAVVIDEYGGTAGIVTVEDILEELFGEIRDEYDEEDVVMRQLDDDTFLAAGQAEVEALNEQFDLALPEGDYETVGGLLLEHLQSIPRPHETIVIKGLTFTVLRASANRVETVRISRLPESAASTSKLRPAKPS